MPSQTLPPAAELITLRELCQLLRISPRTVSRWIETGHLPEPYRLGPGPRLRWDRHEVLDLVRGGDASR